MPIARYIKTPTESKKYVIDYANWLETGETIQAVSFSAPTTSEAVVTSNLVIQSYLIDNTQSQVSYFVGGGDDGATFEVVITITTSSGEIKQDAIQFAIRSAA